jgi:biotin carboxyl carrier protein
VQRISVGVGDTLGAGALVLSLYDTQWSNVFRAKNAWLAIQSAQNTYAIQKKNIEKQIEDLQIAQKRAALDFSTVTDSTGWTTSLQVEWLQKNIEKAKFDYTTKVAADDVTLKNYITTAKNVYSDTLNILIDVIDQADTIVHVKDQQERNQGYIYFAGKSDLIKNTVENELRALISKKIQLEQKGNAITENNLQEYLATYRIYCDDINHFVTTMKDALTQSIVDSRYLSEQQLAWYIASFGGIQAKANWIIASITAQVNGLQLFVATYKDQQKSLASQITILENDVQVRKSQLDQQSKNSALTLEASNSGVWFVTDTKNLQLESLQNSLRQAQLALDEANFNAGKLTVRAPIAGEISDVLVDIGQEINVGTPLVTMVSAGKEVDVSLAQAELEGLFVWGRVTVEDDYGKWEGTIVSIGSVAEKSGNFPVKIRVTRWEFAIGSFVQVLLWAQRSGLLVPINAVTVVDNGVGQIVLWDGTTLETMLVTLWETFGSLVEVKDTLPSYKKLVISDTQNYDAQTMKITEK